MANTEKLFQRLDDLLDRLEAIIPPQQLPQLDKSYHAYRWHDGKLQGIAEYHALSADDLLFIDRQARLLFNNTRQFMLGHPANNVLLWGARGTGKSSIIKAQLKQFREDGLCMVEVTKKEADNLFDIISTLAQDGRQYIIYLDDLSFESDDESYKALKATLEGSIQSQPQNVLIYATSNRRHLMPESMKDNLDSQMENGQLHPSDSIEEKISLSDRFGLWLSFHPFTQDQYLGVVKQELEKLGLALDPSTQTEALRFATARGSRNGRIAHQFATFWLGNTL